MAVKTAISTFCRIKPFNFDSDNEIQEYSITNEPDKDTLTIYNKKQLNGAVNNKPCLYSFLFTKVFDQDASQEDVYDRVARSVVESVLQGYNGTIFAYGQTGSGKTYTISGESGKEGIVSRALQNIFNEINNREDQYEVHISYLEIYNENSNDLLTPDPDEKKIWLGENTDKVMEWHNLNVKSIETCQEAIDLIQIGDQNRIVGDTSMNVYSSRSHTVLTVYITGHDKDSLEIHRAKLNLVDLAGSERADKTGEEGVVLEEARHINLSLHFLEQVIIALSDVTRTHVPYRNCTLTSALRDSLGGNCLTVMVATVSVDKANVDETVSTCRFAQRASLVRNDLTANRERDLDAENALLRAENLHLKTQCAELREKLSTLENSENDERRVVQEGTQRSDTPVHPIKEAFGDQSLYTDVIYLMDLLQDEQGGERTGQLNDSTMVQTDEEFGSLATTGLNTMDEWLEAKKSQEELSNDLQKKKETITSIQQDILNWWRQKEKPLVKNITESPCNVLLQNHSSLLKDFQELKFRLLSAKRNAQEIKEKYCLEFDDWKKNVKPPKILTKDNSLKEIYGKHMEGVNLEHDTEKRNQFLVDNAILDSATAFMQREFGDCNDQSFLSSISDVTFSDMNSSLWSTSTSVSDTRLSGRRHGADVRASRSVPGPLDSDLRGRRSRGAYTQTLPVQLTGDPDIDEEIRAFYKNRYLNN